jgi:2-dehydro-3-deoxyphosphogluconate aldolase/(4S)-4-hydroxy-2-oxoglutarate aldolase
MSDDAFLRDVLRRSPVIPVLTVTRIEHAVPLAEALVGGGLVVLEVTLRSPVALDVIRAMRRAVPEAIVGVGTLVRPEQFAQAADAGAQFGVSPGLTTALAAAAATVPYPLLPGVMTPSELLAARAQGFSTCKLFPAQQAGGVGMLKALHAVFPEVLFCPTGGIGRQNAGEFLSLPNVACVGGSWVAPAEALEKGDWARVRELAADAASLARPVP